MEAADELTVLRIIVDALNNGDYDHDPQQWKELAKAAREQRFLARTVTRACVASDMEIG